MSNDALTELRAALDTLEARVREVEGERDEALRIVRAYEGAQRKTYLLGVSDQDHTALTAALIALRDAVREWDANLSSYCDGEERDRVRAALLRADRALRGAGEADCTGPDAGEVAP